MTIGLDIDDTMTNSSQLIAKYAKEYFTSYNTEMISTILHAEKIEGELLEFYNKYLPKMMENYELKENVQEVIKRLRLQGHKIIIVTARGYTVQEGLIEITKKYLEKYNIKVDDIIFRTLYKNEICVNNKVDIMVDDSISVLEKVKKSGIKALLFTSSNNQHISTTIDRVDNWLDLEKYINKIANRQD